jgi:hypothetical protein
MMCHSSTDKLPFCEECNCCTEEDSAVIRLLWTDDTQEPDLNYELAGGGISTLHQYTTISEIAPDSLRLNLCRCPQCDQSNYLTINRVHVSTDKLSAVTFNSTLIIRHLVISTADVELLKAAQTLSNDADEESTENDSLSGE